LEVSCCLGVGAGAGAAARFVDSAFCIRAVSRRAWPLFDAVTARLAVVSAARAAAFPPVSAAAARDVSCFTIVSATGLRAESGLTDTSTPVVSPAGTGRAPRPLHPARSASESRAIVGKVTASLSFSEAMEPSFRLGEDREAGSGPHFIYRKHDAARRGLR
jgi:hypothetical protein